MIINEIKGNITLKMIEKLNTLSLIENAIAYCFFSVWTLRSHAFLVI